MKPINDSKGEITYASWFTDWFAEEAKRTYGKTIPSTMQGRRIITIKTTCGSVWYNYTLEFSSCYD